MVLLMLSLTACGNTEDTNVLNITETTESIEDTEVTTVESTNETQEAEVSTVDTESEISTGELETSSQVETFDSSVETSDTSLTDTVVATEPVNDVDIKNQIMNGYNAGFTTNSLTGIFENPESLVSDFVYTFSTDEVINDFGLSGVSVTAYIEDEDTYDTKVMLGIADINAEFLGIKELLNGSEFYCVCNSSDDREMYSDLGSISNSENVESIQMEVMLYGEDASYYVDLNMYIDSDNTNDAYLMFSISDIFNSDEENSLVGKECWFKLRNKADIVHSKVQELYSK
jgi:hypothetical protein